MIFYSCCGDLDIYPRFCHVIAMLSCPVTGESVISARGGRYRPKSDFLSIRYPVPPLEWLKADKDEVKEK